MKKVVIIIQDRMKRGEANGSLLYATKMRRSNLMFLPFEHIKAKESTIMRVTNTHSEPATKFTIPLWLYRKKESQLKELGDRAILPQL